jgi:maltooligosyltrehalose trehalohydrolase
VTAGRSGYQDEPGFGATIAPDKHVRFRIWAPGVEHIDLVLGDPPVERRMPVGLDGWAEMVLPGVTAGTPYRYRLPDGTLVPDPASRAQRGGPFGPSWVTDPGSYRWQTADWRGRPWEETVLYELHCGAIARPGGFEAVRQRLAALADLGVTAIELMPLSDFVGARGWGYDGVLPFAPASIYGTPDELKALVDAAHGRGLMVFLDVVYNHFGPAGNFLPLYAPSFFDSSRQTPWGPAVDFGRPAVRAFFRENALYWLGEFRFDGLRFDAVHAIADDSKTHILTEIAIAAAAAFPDRHVHLVLENDDNEASRLIGSGGSNAVFRAQWNDDLHHVFHVLATGERDGYYRFYADDAVARLGRGLAEGFVYQGETPSGREAARGEPSRHLPPAAFVNFLQNHDQIGNRASGDRLTTLAAPETVAVLTALLILTPPIPLLFMGEETGSRSPFPYFCDFDGDVAEAVRRGRREEFSHFAAFVDPATLARLPDPLAQATFDSAVPVPDMSAPHAAAERRALVSTLLALRRHHIVPHLAALKGGSATWTCRGSLLDIAWTLPDGGVWHILANLGDGAADAYALPPGRTIFASRTGLGDGAVVHGAAGWWLLALHEEPTS